MKSVELLASLSPASLVYGKDDIGRVGNELNTSDVSVNGTSVLSRAQKPYRCKFRLRTKISECWIESGSKPAIKFSGRSQRFDWRCSIFGAANASHL